MIRSEPLEPVRRPVFRCVHRVTYAECTAGNHVYHGRFFDILERARGEWFRSMDCPFVQWQEQDIIFPVRGCRMKFRAMARYDELLEIEMWAADIRRARFLCASRILNASGALLNEAGVDVVCTTLEGRPRGLPARLTEALSWFRGPVLPSDTAA